MTKPCYDVGYGKPPLHTRFRKGQSGNPKGRSKARERNLTKWNWFAAVAGGADHGTFSAD
jgi:hypothetical protein